MAQVNGFVNRFSGSVLKVDRRPFFRPPTDAFILLIRRQAVLRDRDGNGLFLACAKDFKCDNVAHAHIEHHIDYVILAGDVGCVVAHGCAYEDVTRLQYAVCERAA